jgi:hypothetical protein
LGAGLLQLFLTLAPLWVEEWYILQPRQQRNLIQNTC